MACYTTNGKKNYHARDRLDATIYDQPPSPPTDGMNIYEQRTLDVKNLIRLSHEYYRSSHWIPLIRLSNTISTHIPNNHSTLSPFPLPPPLSPLPFPPPTHTLHPYPTRPRPIIITSIYHTIARSTNIYFSSYPVVVIVIIEIPIYQSLRCTCSS